MSVNVRGAVRALAGCAAWALLAGAALAAAPQQAPEGAFGNGDISANWKLTDGALSNLVVHDERHGARIEITDPFSLTMKGGRTLGADAFRLRGVLQSVALPADAKASRLVEHFPGKAVEGRFVGPDGHVAIDWKLVQRDGSDYLREIVTITALDEGAPITKVSLFGANAPDAFVEGTVDGSPVVSHDDWLGFEHPMSKADAWRGKVGCSRDTCKNAP